MGIKISGMNSNLDTDGIVQEMVKAYSKKKENLTKSQTILGWKQEAYATLNAKFKKLYTKTMGNLKFADSFNKKSTVISNPAIAKIVADAGAINGTQTLRVQELAKSGYLTGGKLTKNASGNAMNVTGGTSLKDMGILADGENATLNMKVNGKSTDIEINADTTIDSLVSSLKDAGVSASFDEKNKRLNVNANNSGEQADFSLRAVDAKGMNVLAGLRLVTADEVADLANFNNLTQDKQDAIYLNEYNELKATYQGRLDREVKNQDLLQTEKDRLTGLTSGLENGVSKYMDPGDPEYDSDVANAMSLTGSARKDALQSLTAENTPWDEKRKAAELKLKEAPLDTWTQADKDRLLAEQADAKKFLEKDVAVKGLAANYAGIDNCTKGISDSVTNQAKYTKYVNNTGNILMTETTANLASKIVKAQEVVAAAANDQTGPVRIKGQDAMIYLNGAQYTSDTNSFTVNNLTITAQEVTGTEEVSISTSEDVDGVYNVIKGFIKEYNDLIKDMDTRYNSASSKGYDPLTPEEKEALSDEEVKKWEDKIKDSVLRRDSNLGSNISFLKTAMMKSYTVNGTNYSLASFGIETMSYMDAAVNEKGLYHIAGDKDDSDSSDLDDKLKTMLATNKDDVVGFFTQLTGDMYGQLQEKTKSNDYRTRNNMYDDKLLTKQYEDYTKQIAQQEKKIKAMEDKYYKQFTAMEVALSKINSKSSSLAGLLGG